jgi:hypothetical protein
VHLPRNSQVISINPSCRFQGPEQKILIDNS